MERHIDNVNSPSDLKKLTIKELSEYADEVRDLIIKSVNDNGGHLASNLGAVDFTIALHYVFSSPKDKLIFDVGHQAYTHKIITGRKDGFSRLRKDGGISGFVNSSESEHDCCTMGHSSTSLSIGLGFARARKIKQEDYSVVSIIGDGAFTGGIAFEALNDIGASGLPMIIVLNDNKMSISKNVGGMSKHLSRLRASKKYVSFKRNLRAGLSGIPFVGGLLCNLSAKIRDGLKNVLVGNKMFENFGVKYFGPFDGHDIPSLVKIFSDIKNYDAPAIIHLVTDKGKGYIYAEEDPTKYHGVSLPKEEERTSFASHLGDKLNAIMQESEDIAVVTAAMSDGTGVKKVFDKFSDRCFDVGIAEQHAVSLCSGLSRGGLFPVFAVYSTFLQRAYDEIMTDLCIDKTPGILAIEHAGYVDGDGVTHQGLYDIGYLSQMPNIRIYAPKNGQELEEMLDFAYKSKATTAIRYPKSYSTSACYKHKPFDEKWEELKADGKVIILACSAKMVELACCVGGVTVINARVVKPLDKEYLNTLEGKKIIILEDGAIRGGFGESVLAYLNENGITCKTKIVGFSDEFVTSLKEDLAYEKQGLTVENLRNIIKNFDLTEEI